MTPLRIFVRRGAIRRFHLLKRDAAGLPVRIEWDRRERERRAESTPSPEDQRRADRRNEPPFTWNTAEFVVVNEPSEEG